MSLSLQCRNIIANFSFPLHALTILKCPPFCSWDYVPRCRNDGSLGGNRSRFHLNKATALYLFLESWQDKFLPIRLAFLSHPLSLCIFFSVPCNCHCLSIRNLILIQPRKLVYINIPGAWKNQWGSAGLRELFKEWLYWDLGFLPKRNLIYSVPAFSSPLISFRMSWHRYRPVPS